MWRHDHRECRPRLVSSRVSRITFGSRASLSLSDSQTTESKIKRNSVKVAFSEHQATPREPTNTDIAHIPRTPRGERAGRPNRQQPCCVHRTAHGDGPSGHARGRVLVESSGGKIHHYNVCSLRDEPRAPRGARARARVVNAWCVSLTHFPCRMPCSRTECRALCVVSVCVLVCCLRPPRCLSTGPVIVGQGCVLCASFRDGNLT